MLGIRLRKSVRIVARSAKQIGLTLGWEMFSAVPTIASGVALVRLVRSTRHANYLQTKSEPDGTAQLHRSEIVPTRFTEYPLTIRQPSYCTSGVC